MKLETGLTAQNFADLVTPTGNIYESTVIIAKKAKLIASEFKEELNSKLAEYDLHQEEGLEEVVENQEHIEISKFYERKPKPTIIATHEFLEGKIKSHVPEVAAQKAKIV